METSKNDLWRACLSYIQNRLPSESFLTWLAPTHVIEVQDSLLVIGVPNKFVVDWIRSHYTSLIDEAISVAIGRPGQHRLEVRGNGNGNGHSLLGMGNVTEKEDVTGQDFTTEVDDATRVRRTADARGRAHLNPKFTFDSFVVGESNQLAHAAAEAVAEMPGSTKFNPLFIYGSVGLGKTHLGQAIGNMVLEDNPGASVIYVTSEKFTNEFIDSLSRKTMSAFTSRYRSVDVLIIDDIQFLSGKESTQEQFFHTFNALHQTGKQIVLTADRAPRDIKGLE